MDRDEVLKSRADTSSESFLAKFLVQTIFPQPKVTTNIEDKNNNVSYQNMFWEM